MVNSNKIATSGKRIHSSINDLMNTKYNFLTIDKEGKYIYCLVRNIAGDCKVQTYGETTSDAINSSLVYFRKGFSNNPIWTDKPKGIPKGVVYSPLDMAILDKGIWIITDREKNIMKARILFKKEGVANPQELFSSSGTDFRKIYLNLILKVKEQYNF